MNVEGRRVKGAFLDRLWQRETCPGPPGTALHGIRQLYQNIVPNTHIASLQPSSPCYLDGFSPCGQYLIGFGRELTSVLIFEYKGIPNLEEPITFDDMFSLVHEVHHEEREGTFGLLDRMVLFFHGSYMVVSSSRQDGQYLEPEGQWLGIEEEVVLHIIHLETGEIMDRIAFVTERLDTPLSHAVATYEKKIAIVNKRSIVLVHVEENGVFSDVMEIGKYCRPDDEDFIRAHHPDIDQEPSGTSDGQQHSPILDGLKQRLLAYMYLEASQNNGDICCQEKERPGCICKSAARGNGMGVLYYFFKVIETLELGHLHFLDDHRLLLFWKTSSTTSRSDMMSDGLKTIYNIQTTFFEKVFTMFDQTEFSSWIQGDANAMNKSLPSSMWEQFSLHGLHGHAAWRNIVQPAGQVPLTPCQHRQTSPYLDKELFFYDERSISRDRIPVSSARIKTAKFMAHAWPNHLKFALDVDKCLHMSSSDPQENEGRIRRRIDALHLFHPTEPTVLCIVQTYEEYQGEAEIINVFTYT